MDDSIFFAFMSRMKYITRWGLMRNTDSENIQEHSLQVAILAHALTLIHNKLKGADELSPDRACVYAIYHDTDEIITGDLPTPIKYFNKEIKENYHEIERTAKEKIISMLPADFQETYKDILFYDEKDKEYYPIVKAADRLSAYIKCIEEVKAGNQEFAKAKDSVMASMKAMNLPELDYFIENFLPAYSLTLDELNK